MALKIKDWLRPFVVEELHAVIAWKTGVKSEVKHEPGTEDRFGDDGSNLRSFAHSLSADSKLQLQQVLEISSETALVVLSDGFASIRARIHKQPLEALKEETVDGKFTKETTGDIFQITSAEVVGTNYGETEGFVTLSVSGIDYLGNKRKLIGSPVPIWSYDDVSRTIDAIRDIRKTDLPTEADEADEEIASQADEQALGSLQHATVDESQSQDLATQIVYPTHEGHASKKRRVDPSLSSDGVQVVTGINLGQPTAANAASPRKSKNVSQRKETVSELSKDTLLSLMNPAQQRSYDHPKPETTKEEPTKGPKSQTPVPSRVPYNRRRIPVEQQKLIDKDCSWFPALPGEQFPIPNVPIDLLTLWSTQEVSVVPEGAGGNTAQEQQEAERSESSDSESGTPIPWASSPPPREQLPPDSTAGSHTESAQAVERQHSHTVRSPMGRVHPSRMQTLDSAQMQASPSRARRETSQQTPQRSQSNSQAVGSSPPREPRAMRENRSPYKSKPRPLETDVRTPGPTHSQDHTIPPSTGIGELLRPFPSQVSPEKGAASAHDTLSIESDKQSNANTQVPKLSNDHDESTPDNMSVDADSSSQTKNTTGRGRKQSLDDDPAKIHVCPTCNVRFARLEHLKRHDISFHTDKRLFECPECGKRCFRSDNLAQHRRTHSRSTVTSRRSSYDETMNSSGLVKSSEAGAIAPNSKTQGKKPTTNNEVAVQKSLAQSEVIHTSPPRSSGETVIKGTQLSAEDDDMEMDVPRALDPMVMHQQRRSIYFRGTLRRRWIEDNKEIVAGSRPSFLAAYDLYQKVHPEDADGPVTFRRTAAEVCPEVIVSSSPPPQPTTEKKPPNPKVAQNHTKVKESSPAPVNKLHAEQNTLLTPSPPPKTKSTPHSKQESASVQSDEESDSEPPTSPAGYVSQQQNTQESPPPPDIPLTAFQEFIQSWRDLRPGGAFAKPQAPAPKMPTRRLNILGWQL